MSTKSQVLYFLNENLNRWVSGQELADRLGLSRNSVWKAVQKLQEQGYPVKSLPRKGYRMTKASDILSKDLISTHLEYPCQIHIYDKLDSTNNMAKEIRDCTIPQIILADEQTAGRGRLGRSFHSPAGKGLYMSIVFKPDFGLERALLTTATIALAACEAIFNVTGLNPKIKWVNDLYLNGKKISGILTEAESGLETGNMEKIIVGIGINCFEGSFPEDLKDTADYLRNPPKAFTRNDLAAAIINSFFQRMENFNQIHLIREYRAKSFILGEQILIYNPAVARAMGRSDDRLHEGIKARAIDIDENGGLVVEYMEGTKMRTMETLTTGEITVRKA